jgi:hypothetical protein
MKWMRSGKEFGPPRTALTTASSLTDTFWLNIENNDHNTSEKCWIICLTFLRDDT